MLRCCFDVAVVSAFFWSNFAVIVLLMALVMQYVAVAFNAAHLGRSMVLVQLTWNTLAAVRSQLSQDSPLSFLCSGAHHLSVCGGWIPTRTQ